MRCHSCGLPELYEALEGWKSICGRPDNLKGKISVFLLFFKLCFSKYCSSFQGMMRGDPAVAGGDCLITNINILLLRSNPSRQYSKVLYRWRVWRRGKTGKHRKVRVKGKRWGLAQPPILHKELGGSHSRWNYGTRGIDPLTRRRTQGPGIVKCWKEK